MSERDAEQLAARDEGLERQPPPLWPKQTRVFEFGFGGWSAIYFTNGIVSAFAVPNLGGRIMSFALGPHQFLFTNRTLEGQLFTPEEHLGDGSFGAWKNYGGDKTWPAPQGWESESQWPGPPDPVLDSGSYTFELLEEHSFSGVTMVSLPDERTGLRIHRRASIAEGAAKLKLELTFENVADRTIRWSIWDVLQLDCALMRGGVAVGPNTDCWLYVPLGPTGRYWSMVGEFGEQCRSEIAPGVLGVQYLGAMGKIGAASTAGWLAFSDIAAGYSLCLAFPHEVGAEYPNGGATVECFTESPRAEPTREMGSYTSVGYVLEAEVLGPLVVLEPGERSSLTIEWAAACCPGPISAVNATGCISEPLRVLAQGRHALLTGVFGCFEEGEISCVWLNQADVALHRVPMMNVSPLAALHLEQVLDLPGGAAGAALELRRADGSFVDRLAHATIE